MIQLKFDRENRPVIVGIKRVSRPSRRVYVGAQAMTPIRKGLESTFSRRREGYWWIGKLREQTSEEKSSVRYGSLGEV